MNEGLRCQKCLNLTHKTHQCYTSVWFLLQSQATSTKHDTRQKFVEKKIYDKDVKTGETVKIYYPKKRFSNAVWLISSLLSIVFLLY